MNKKAITILVLLAFLALPMAATAAVSTPAKPGDVEFTLGGYVKMEVIWDSTQTNKWLYYGMARNNDPNLQHGRLKFSASQTRMNFTVKGPKVFGATTLAFIEWDFDNIGNVNAGAAANLGWVSENKSRLGLRHAFFKLNWPETELLMGSYWSILTEEIPETANFGACTTAGQPFLREPQICLTQTAGVGGGKLTASLAVAGAVNGMWGLQFNANQTAAANNFGGESTETPRLEGRVKYDIDLWGKAAFWGKPRPFSVRAGASWYKERFRSYAPVAANTFSQNNFLAGTAGQRDQQYLDHWMVEGSMFIPLIPTHSANLAGTASLLTQWFVGAGLYDMFEDTAVSGSYLNYVGGGAFGGAGMIGDRQLMQRFGGFIQLQYYFTNQWYLNAVWGINRAFNVDMDRWIGDTAANDPIKTNQHYYLCLWYRPIQALKFGLEYTYARTDYFQIRGNTAAGVAHPTNLGENHRMMFCGFLYF